MRVKTWKILNHGNVPEDSRTIEYTCMTCGREAEMPVIGTALAQLDEALVFDIGHHDVPILIQCRKCGQVYAHESYPSEEPADVR